MESGTLDLRMKLHAPAPDPLYRDVHLLLEEVLREVDLRDHALREPPLPRMGKLRQHHIPITPSAQEVAYIRMPVRLLEEGLR